ncbi:MAG: hypothetical protein KKH04_20715 [Proteobacteria bacterium]|nr:hypothetical protein [Pseudomonadota bacterium]
MNMKTIETTGRILEDGNIELDHPVTGPAGNVRLVILYPDDFSEDRPPKLSPEEKTRIIEILDSVAESSLKEGPPVSNRNHDQYLYGGNG